MADDADRADASANPVDERTDDTVARLGALLDQRRHLPPTACVLLVPQADFVAVQRALHRRGELVVTYVDGRQACWRGAELFGYSGPVPRLMANA